MSRRTSLSVFATTLARTTVARARRGPVRPDWSLLYEAAIATTRSLWSAPQPMAERRAWFEKVGQAAPAARVSRTMTTLGGRPAEWQVAPGAPADAPVVLYLHGGGYGIGSIRTHRPLTTALAETAGLRLVSLDYRLAPEHPCPAAVDDAVAAYRALLAEGTDPSRLFIAGDSAGGGLTLATLVALRDAGDPLPAGGVLLSPWTDLTRNLPATDVDYIVGSLWEVYVPGYAATLGADDPRVSPLRADLAGVPPLLVIAGGAETLLPDSTALADKAAAAGVEVALHVEPHEVHVYPFYAAINPRGRAALTRIADWIAQRSGAHR